MYIYIIKNVACSCDMNIYESMGKNSQFQRVHPLQSHFGNWNYHVWDLILKR